MRMGRPRVDSRLAGLYLTIVLPEASMATTRLSTKGQLIIPKEIREHRGWDAGTELVVEEVGEAVVIRAVPTVRATKLKDVLGCLRYAGKPKTLKDMERAIADGATEAR